MLENGLLLQSLVFKLQLPFLFLHNRYYLYFLLYYLPVCVQASYLDQAPFTCRLFVKMRQDQDHLKHCLGAEMYLDPDRTHNLSSCLPCWSLERHPYL